MEESDPEDTEEPAEEVRELESHIRELARLQGQDGRQD